MTEYTFENNALYRYIPIDANTTKRELVITKDEFLMCYIKWICPELLNHELEKLKKNIEDKVYNISAYNECLDCDVIDYEDVNEIIQEKINALKENKDGKK